MSALIRFFHICAYVLVLSLPAINFSHAAEVLDLTTFTNAVDPADDVSVSSECLTFTDVETRNRSSVVYKPVSVTGDFVYEFDTILTDSDMFSGELAVFGMSNSAGETFDDWDDGWMLGWYMFGVGGLRMDLDSSEFFNRNSEDLDMNTRYYFRVERQNMQLTVSIFTDPSRTNLFDTISRETEVESYNYLYVFSTDNANTTTKRSSGQVCNIVNGSTPQEPQPPATPGAPSFSSAGEASLTVSWNEVSGVTGYRLDVADNAGFSPMLSGYNNRDVGTSLSQSLSGLDSNQTYYARLRAVNAIGSSGNSNTGSGSTLTPADNEAPAAPGVAQISAIESDGFTVSWTASPSPDVAQYRVETATDSGFSAIVSTRTVGASSTTTQISNLNAGETYHVQVSAIDGSGNVSLPGASAWERTLTLAATNTVYVQDVTYTEFGQLDTVTLGNGLITDYDYEDLTLRLKRLRTYSPTSGEHIQDLNYQYDNVGNIIRIDDNVNNRVQEFTYDHLNRLATANGTIYGSKSYEYDAVGNIKEKDGKAYAYGEGGAGPHAVTSVTAPDGTRTTYTYDDNGNMATKQVGNADVRHFVYDIENRLTRIEERTSQGSFIREIARYAYDGDGGRVSKQVNGITTQFVGKLVEVAPGSTRNAIYLGNQRVATLDGEHIYYTHANHLGSTKAITDEFADIKEQIEYDPWGRIEQRNPTFNNPIQSAKNTFTSQYLDDESGLYYYGARYYDAELGRFITADTIVQDNTNPQTFSRYSYTSNNPVNRIDPDGRSWLKNVFKKLDRLFGKFQKWLEKVTGHQWYINAEFSQSYEYQDAETFARATADVGWTALTQPWQVGIGVKNWAHDPRLKILKVTYGSHSHQILLAVIQDSDHLFNNGILNSEEKAITNAKLVGATKVAYNPTDGPLADLTEAFLQKLTFTSSIDRQLANMLVGHKNIRLSGHSQGAIVASNTLLNLGLRGARNSVTKAIFHNTQITKARAYASSAMAGVQAKNVIYGSRYFDPSNVVAPNLSEPLKFLSGIAGFYLPFGLQYHGLK